MTTTVWFVLGESCFCTFIDSGKGYTNKKEAQARLDDCKENANSYPDVTRLSLQSAEVLIN